MPIDRGGILIDGPSIRGGAYRFCEIEARLGGFKELRRTLAAFDRDAERVMVRAIQGTADKVVGDAKGRASSWARTGNFMETIGRRTYARGVRIVTTHEAGGVLEYAHAGARSLSGRRVGTPPGAPNKAITKAVETNQEWIISRVDAAIAQALAKVRGE